MLTTESKAQIDSTANLKPTIIVSGKGTVIIEPYVTIEDYVLLDTNECGTIHIGTRSKLKHGVVLRAYDGFIRIGSRVTIGEYSILAGHGGIVIGDTVAIAGHCYITAQNHIFSSDIPTRFQGETTKGINIGFGAWIGGRCVILDGTNLGEYCVIGAGSVVTKSISKNMICYGNPCKEIRSRKQQNSD